MKVDLHCHSTASDGVLTPRALYEQAVVEQVELLALTDHDTVQGYLELRDAIAAGQLQEGTQLLAGVEISCAWRGIDIHVLGIDVDVAAASLQRLLEHHAKLRHQRARAMLVGLEHAGAAGLSAGFPAMVGAGVPGRLHLARLLVNAGHAPDIRRAFRRWLKPLRSARKVPWTSLQDVVSIINNSAGAAVLAHPLAYSLSVSNRRKLVEEFAAAGGAAIEISVPGYDIGQRQMLAALAELHKLAGSAGSDFHAQDQWRRLGLLPALPDGLKPVWTAWKAA